MIKYLLIVLSILYFAGCASSTKVTTAPGNKQPAGKYDESFDPTTLDDDDIIIKKQETNIQNQQSEDSNTSVHEVNENIIMNEVDGYRVQILATQGIESATLRQQKALDKFADKGYKVYLIYEAPLYRLRIGDAVTRREAEIIRDLAKTRGYDEAFIVRSKVMAPQATGTNIDQ